MPPQKIGRYQILEKLGSGGMAVVYLGQDASFERQVAIKVLAQNHGADPDIFIDNDPGSVLAGRDLQLEKAIEVMLDKIKKNPGTYPPAPAYPKK